MSFPAVPATTRSTAAPAPTRCIGGAGNDTYVVDNAGDVVIEAAATAPTRCRLGQLHARRQCREPDPDRQRRINGTGNALANIITGNGGNNMLDGGAGADTMAGGAGNDTYVVDNAGDVVTEVAREGTDTVQSVDHLHARRQCREPDPDRQRRINGTGNASPTSSPATAATTCSTAAPAPTP